MGSVSNKEKAELESIKGATGVQPGAAWGVGKAKRGYFDNVAVTELAQKMLDSGKDQWSTEEAADEAVKFLYDKKYEDLDEKEVAMVTRVTELATGIFNKKKDRGSAGGETTAKSSYDKDGNKIKFVSTKREKDAPAYVQ